MGIRFTRIVFLHLVHFAFDAEQFLHMMPEFVGDYIGLGELAGGAEAAIQLIEKTQIDVDPFVFGTIERPGGRARSAASGLRGVTEQDELGVAIVFAGLVGKKLRPCFLRVVERKGHERDQRALRSIARRIGLPDLRWSGSCSTTAQQGEKIGFEDEAENQKNDGSADADVQAAELEASASTCLIAAIFDVLAFAAV